MNTQDRTKCVSNSMIYFSNPPQNKCINCGKYWVMGEKTPDCNETQDRTIRDVKEGDIVIDQFNDEAIVLAVGKNGFCLGESSNDKDMEYITFEEAEALRLDLKQPEKQEIKPPKTKSLETNDVDVWRKEITEAVNKLLEK